MAKGLVRSVGTGGMTSTEGSPRKTRKTRKKWKTRKTEESEGPQRKPELGHGGHGARRLPTKHTKHTKSGMIEAYRLLLTAAGLGRRLGFGSVNSVSALGGLCGERFGSIGRHGPNDGVSEGSQRKPGARTRRAQSKAGMTNVE